MRIRKIGRSVTQITVTGRNFQKERQSINRFGRRHRAEKFAKQIESELKSYDRSINDVKSIKMVKNKHGQAVTIFKFKSGKELAWNEDSGVDTP